MLHFITGPMFAGKSKYLIKTINCYMHEFDSFKVLFIYPEKTYRGYFCRDKDTEFDSRVDIITEYEFMNENNSDSSFIENKILSYDIIAIDEFCFLEDTNFFLELLNKYSKQNNFIIATLDRDFKRVIWDSVAYILDSELMDAHTQLSGRCECGKRGLYSKRTVYNTSQVVIGDSIYKCACKDCHESENTYTV